MRLLLGGLVLVTLFAAAAIWQRSWTRAARSERPRRTAEHWTADPAEAGWSRVVVGHPSGGEPFPGPAYAPGPDPPGGREAAPPAEPDARAARRSTHGMPAAVVVRSGETLSRICSGHYGSARRELVEAVARYNRLEDPDQLREGQTLLLPPEPLLPAKPR